MYVDPPTNEVVLHPEAVRIAKLSPSERLARTWAELDAQAQMPVPDLERVMGLGQLMRLKGEVGLDEELVGWLDAHPTTSGLDVVCLFVSGYWSGQEPSKTLASRLIGALGVHALPLLEALAAGEPLSAPVGIADSIVLALVSAYATSTDEALRLDIRSTLLAFVPIAPYLQSASQGGFTHATGVSIVAPPPAFPVENYRAYACQEGDNEFFVIEQRVNHREVLRVAPPVLAGTNLELTYEILVPKLRDPSACALIFRCLLVELLEDSYRSQVTLVFYKNQTTKSTSSARYG